MLARTGGDEFCIVLPASTLREGALIARRVLEVCRGDAEACVGADVPISVSIGVALWTREIGAFPDRLMAAADHALYAAKNDGRDRYAVYHPAPPVGPGHAVETDGTVYWAVPENLVPTHGDGANRNDNKYIDNGPTFHQVVGSNSIGVEFAGNYPDVTRGATEAQIAAWRILVRVLRARYGIPVERVYAHNWIDHKDARYCEGCALATLARQWGP